MRKETENLFIARYHERPMVMSSKPHKVCIHLPVRLLLSPRALQASSAVFVQHPRDQTVRLNAAE